jgi:hypothetical protein
MSDSNSGQDRDQPQPGEEPSQERPAYPVQGQQPGPSASPYGAPPPGQPYGGYGTPYPTPAYPAYGAPATDPDKRPGGVTAACVLTWVLGGIALIGSGFLLLSAVAAREDFIREVEQDDRYEDLDVGADTLADVIAGTSLATMALSLLAIVLAVMAYRRSRAGRVGLILLSVVAALIALPLSLAVIGVPWLVASIATIVLLAGRRAGDWYQRRDVARPYAQDPGAWTPGGPQA